uniref:Peptidase M12B propeptide domain-containing protein n=1 Tax=Cyanoderma ruficeps TaxID=181631 RepID=A0A8C3RFI0_9PASS
MRRCQASQKPVFWLERHVSRAVTPPAPGAGGGGTGPRPPGRPRPRRGAGAALRLWAASVQMPARGCCGCVRLSLLPSVAETLVKQLSSYEIITPVRVNEFGEVFPHTHHFRRRKRSLEAPLEPAAFRTHYQLRAYGQVFQLNLSADAGFVAAQYTVVHVGAPQEQSSPDLRHCFYRGHVNAQETHMAVFSICGGLVSMLVTASCLHSYSPR